MPFTKITKSFRYVLGDIFIFFLAIAIVLTNPLFYGLFMLFFWIPNKRKAINFIKPGELYCFKSPCEDVYFRVWKNKQDLPEINKIPIIFGITEIISCKASMYLSYGDNFLVLNCERKSPIKIILKILYGDKIGYCQIIGKNAIRPWKKFKKV